MLVHRPLTLEHRFYKVAQRATLEVVGGGHAVALVLRLVHAHADLCPGVLQRQVLQLVLKLHLVRDGKGHAALVLLGNLQHLVADVLGVCRRRISCR